MASSEPVREVIRHVKPLLSSNRQEARKRVLNLYKTWYKGLPAIIFDYNLPISFEEARQKLRNNFLKHKHLTDPRTIDMLVIKGQMEYQEIAMSCCVKNLDYDARVRTLMSSINKGIPQELIPSWWKEMPDI